MQISNPVQSIPLDFSGNGLGMALGIFGGLNRLLQSMPTSQPHSCTCAVLCSYPGPELERLSQKCAALPPYGLFSRHILLFLSILLPTIPGCYHQQSMVGSIWLSVFETYTLALLSPRILQAVTFQQL